MTRVTTYKTKSGDTIDLIKEADGVFIVYEIGKETEFRTFDEADTYAKSL